MAGDPVPAGAPAVQVVSEELGGSALSRAIQRGSAPATWRLGAPQRPEDWAACAGAVRASFGGQAWLDALEGAVTRTGKGGERLRRTAEAGGVVVTTGQQPGLFGGPIYTWSKALSALALADEIERRTGIPAAPVFWAATDDADLTEAQSGWIAGSRGAVELRGGAAAPPGTPAAATPQGDLQAQLAQVRHASGSAAAPEYLSLAERTYGDPSRPIGAAYVALLEEVLAPLGIPVLDASHPAVRSAGLPLLQRALERSPAVAAALSARGAEIRAAGFEPQVDDVPGLTPVFLYEGDVKRRVTMDEAAALAGRATGPMLGPNVLLRPIMERALLPTVTYVAGPGELAYFAQVTALADALEAAPPMAVARWSGTLIEPHAQRLLDRLGVTRDILEDPHAVEGKLARAAMPAPVAQGIAALRAAAGEGIDQVARTGEVDLLPPPVLDGLRRRIGHQVDRLERRALAAVKRREEQLMRDVAAARGYFFPGGARQERRLVLIPMLARHGQIVLDAMLHEARIHARRLVDGSRA